MLRSKDNTNGKDIILFDLPGDDDSIDNIRDKCRNGIIVCPECDQPVVVKAGTKYINHFAHKSLGSCPLSSESANVLQGRRILYTWLQKKLDSKYPDNHSLILEKIFPCEHLKRPIDCYLELPKDRRFAYLVLDSGMRAAWDIEYFFKQLQLPLVKIFTENMVRLDENKELLRLTPTERRSIDRKEHTLFYLDIHTSKVTTYFGLDLYHSPQEYKFVYSISNKLSDMLISPATGLLAHLSFLKIPSRHKKAISDHIASGN